MFVLCRTPRMENEYKFLDQVSDGIDGSIAVVVHEKENQAYCCRTIYKNRLPLEKRKELFDAIRKEIYLLHVTKETKHTSQIIKVFENSTSVNIIQDWCPRGDFEFILLNISPKTEKDLKSNFFFPNNFIK